MRLGNFQFLLAVRSQDSLNANDLGSKVFGPSKLFLLTWPRRRVRTAGRETEKKQPPLGILVEIQR